MTRDELFEIRDLLPQVNPEFFVIPVIAVEGDGSFSAIGRSKDIMVAKWGKVVRSSLRFGVMFLLPVLGCFALTFAGFAAAIVTGNFWLLGISMIGLLGLLVVSLVSNAVSTYLRTALYRHAVGMPVAGISEEVLAGAIQAK